MTFDFSPVVGYLPELMAGLRATAWISLLGSMLALAVGIGAAAADANGRFPVRLLVRLFVEAMRGIPFLVLLLCGFYMLPRVGVALSPWWTGVAALAAYYGAYVSEVVRGAIASVPGGQVEAAVAIGMPPLSVLGRVVLPQALGAMLPPLAGLLIGLVKESALLSVISVHEFAFAAREVVSDTYAPFETYAFVGLCYWVVNSALALLFQLLERRAVRYRQGKAAVARHGMQA